MRKTNILLILLLASYSAFDVIVHAQQPFLTQTEADPVFDPKFNGKTYSDRGGPLLIGVKESFFRKSANYPRGETVADGTFLFVRIYIFNNSDAPLQIPRFTLQDSRGNSYLTAIRARRSLDAIVGGESLDPAHAKDGYLIFDLPLSESQSPGAYKLLIENSRHTIKFEVPAGARSR